MAKRVLTGKHFMSGNHAIAEGCLAANCGFFGGYPITPSSEVAEHMAKRLFTLGGTFVQFEDELASIIGVLGASWAGKRSMTATSGPGLSLMLENIGLGAMTETPCVIINVQRGGPSTGLPTLVGQADVMQAKWGSHGDIEIIALAPNSVQECFDLSIEAFNLADQYRVPVIMLTDESTGHMTEGIEIPSPENITLINRKRPNFKPGEKRYLPYEVTDGDLVPPMAHAGEGYQVFMTGLTHDERGYPDISPEAQEKLVTRLSDKILKNKDKIIKYDLINVDDAEVLLIAFGIVSRVAKGAMIRARNEGLKVGMMRLITLWPFAEDDILKLVEEKNIKHIIVAEINHGQVVREVQRAVKGKCEVHLLPKLGGSVHTPKEILNKIKEVLK